MREKEGRVYTDEVLRVLPAIDPASPLAKEWKVRGRTLTRLVQHLQQLPPQQKILDLGCGNGWMSHHFSHLPGAEVTGMDLNTAELQQARRVFADCENLQFLEKNIFEPQASTFDVVCIGGAVQYFPDLSKLVGRLRELLSENGEIHIYDSPFYREAERPAAKARSVAYYEKMGFPALAGCYFQPSIQEMERLGGEILYQPNTFFRRFRRKALQEVDSPFIWWRLRKS
ncbi:MAG TPA: class I SAM-dependent methyltransferase [Bacteroidetes bacterium]|nr:class I SAM-dependent methyltransferase [Bacteroidota bacterium]